MTVEGYKVNLDGVGVRVGIVQARYNSEIGEALFEACVKELKNLGVMDEDMLHITVPGALEIPFTLKNLAEVEQFDALIALGAVVRGETYHFEVVANESAAGMARVALDANIPIVNAVLTTENEEQARARMHDKGREAARVAIEMANLALTLNELSDHLEESFEVDDVWDR